LTLGHYALHVTVTQTLVIVSNKPTDSRAIHVVLHCVHRCMLYSGFLRHTWQTGFRVVAFLLSTHWQSSYFVSAIEWKVWLKWELCWELQSTMLDTGGLLYRYDVVLQ